MPDSDRHLRGRELEYRGCRDRPRDPSGPVDAPPFLAVLAFLTFLFTVRIVAPFLAAYFDTSFLPSFESWHSSTMPYPVLFGFQAIILTAMVGGMWLVRYDKQRPKLGRALIWLGSAYILAMVARLAIGALGLTQSSWFEGAVPTSFHFVLGAYVLTFGAALRQHSQSGLFSETVRRAVRVCAYPGLMIGGLTLFAWLRQTGSPLLFSSYLSVLVAAIGIVLHETLFPARNDWRPAIGEVLQDGLFLAIVQIALPFVLKALALFLIVSVAADGDALISGYWPHHAPVLAQVCLMLLIAEFFRYWIHRSLHVFGPLWQLHAVHHAADKLYTVNVGRFHPFDKAIQFLGDTVPFLLLGVTPEVFGAYFVFYAINGFYQHSNADISLGPINWIIAGPELHRWHHSASIKEAQSNYGNNLIVWDVLFGTRYLPKGQEVGAVGIGNSRWPNGFLRQMTAPFTTPTDRPDK